MKRLGLALSLVVAFVSAASALQQSSQPPMFNIGWGNTAGAGFITYPIPQPSQIGIVNCRASLTDGFPPLTFTPQTSGGCPPFGQDFNGILRWVTLWAQWQGAGGTSLYNGGFSSAIGGYPKSAILQQAAQAGCYWVNLIDNNASNPDTGGSNWSGVCLTQAGTLASLTLADQTVSGGANVTSLGLTTGSVAIDCGLRPLQYIANAGAFTITAPSNDGSCMVQIENTTGAGAVTFTGFQVNANTGEPLTTTNGSKFVVSIWRIHGVASYLIKALQ